MLATAYVAPCLKKLRMKFGVGGAAVEVASGTVMPKLAWAVHATHSGDARNEYDPAGAGGVPLGRFRRADPEVAFLARLVRKEPFEERCVEEARCWLRRDLVALDLKSIEQVPLDRGLVEPLRL